MADYLADLDASIFVLDYDGNVRTLEDLEKSHMPMYRKIRAKHPTTPIIMITVQAMKNGAHMSMTEAKKAVVYQTYLTAKAEGDENVYFIDGTTMYGAEDVDACFSDLLHPNDMGYYRIAKSLQPILMDALKKAYNK